MPLAHIVGFFSGGASIVLGVAMLLVVFVQAPRRRDNQLMAVYLVTLVLVGTANIGARVFALLGLDPYRLIGLAFIATGASRLALFWFVTSYAGIQRHRIVRLVRYGGAVALLFGLWLYQSGGLLTEATITPEGLVHSRLSPITVALAPIGAAITFGSLAYIWLYRRRGTGPLLLGAGIMAVGFLIPLPFVIRGEEMFPVAITAAAVGSVFFTYAILRENLFSPLERSEANLTAMIETSGDPVWSVDANLHVTAFNQAAAQLSERLFGITPRLGEHALRGLVPDAQLLWQRFYDRALRGERISVERHLQVPGLPAHVEFTFGPIRAGGGVAVVMRNISDQRRALTEQAHAREMAEGDSLAKTRLLMTLGDELRAAGAASDPKLSALLDDVGELSLLESGKAPAAEIRFGLREELAAIAKMQRRPVVVETAADVEDSLVGDPRRLGQIIARLVGDDSGPGTATVHVEHEAEMYEAVRLRFEIRGARDDGSGIKQMIVSRLIESMGGRLAMERDASAGATATFALRFARASP
jgi:PAS domain-containing protein